MVKLKLLALAALLGVCYAQSTVPALHIDAGVRVIMRDAAALIANVYRPAAPGKLPVLLVRTPYDRASEEDACRVAAQHDYVCVTQDVRARYASEGKLYPFKDESNDGYDTVEWAAALLESNGKVAMFGESYVGATQWLAAIARPPHLVHARGGGLCCVHDPVVQQPSGAFDQGETETRDDVLVYTTAAFDRNFELIGPIVAEIYVSSSAPDTDITAKLVDVWPNGFAQNLADNIPRLRFRNSSTQPEFLQPGRIYKVQFEIGATSNVFLPDHRLRAEISSSNFPHFDRNLNTPESPEHGSKFVQAHNGVYHDAQYPSAILLPVIQKISELTGSVE
jgi:predicted acyl esterase